MIFTAHVLDLINSVVDLGCFVPAVLGIYEIYKTKCAEGYSIIGQYLYLMCMVWWCFYSWQLSQFWSFASLLVWFVFFVAETILIVKYKRVKVGG